MSVPLWEDLNLPNDIADAQEHGKFFKEKFHLQITFYSSTSIALKLPSDICEKKIIVIVFYLALETYLI